MSVNKYPLICIKCNKSFLGDKPTRKYCSKECAGNANRHITKICLNCETPFTVPIFRKDTAGWCSRICYDTYRQQIKEAQPSCQTPLNQLPQLNNPRPTNFISKRPKGRNRGTKRGTPVLCHRCGINTMPFSPRRKYCDECVRIVNREQSEKRRRRYGIKPQKFNGYAQINNNQPCQICGWNTAACDRHHIIPRKEGGSDDIDNIIVLCPNHHRLADFGILSKEELFSFKRAP